MTANFKLFAAVVLGAVVGGLVTLGVHAQGKPPAYRVIFVQKIDDQAAFKAGVTDKANPADLKAAGGARMIRSTKFVTEAGTPPDFFTIQRFDSVEAAVAFSKTPAQQEIGEGLRKSSTFVDFVVEGPPN